MRNDYIRQQFVLHCKDFLESLMGWRLWLFLGWNDVSMQYKRSFLGPLWITLNTGLFIVAFGFVGSGLFKMNIKDYMPYFCIGQIVFNLFTSCINESCQAYLSAESFLKQIRCPKLTFIFRVLVKNLILFAHNLIILFAVLIWAGRFTDVRWFGFCTGLLTVTVAIWFVMSITAIIATRYRDVPMIVQSILQIAYFVTPVMWKINQLSGKTRTIIELNPLTIFLEIIRNPLLGNSLSGGHFVMVFLCIISLGIISWIMYVIARRKIVYWL